MGDAWSESSWPTPFPLHGHSRTAFWGSRDGWPLPRSRNRLGIGAQADFHDSGECCTGLHIEADEAAVRASDQSSFCPVLSMTHWQLAKEVSSCGLGFPRQLQIAVRGTLV